MVQQYVSAVDAHGETGMVFIGGDFSHAFRKEPILTSTIRIGRWHVRAGNGPRPRLRRRRSIAVAERVVASLPATAYARVDLLPTADGPVLLELEVIEPSLFLHLDPSSPARAAAVFRNLVT